MRLRVCGEYYPNINRSEWCVIANNENVLSTFSRWDTAVSYACWLAKQHPPDGIRLFLTLSGWRSNIHSVKLQRNYEKKD